jgi:hypothetical protein
VGFWTHFWGSLVGYALPLLGMAYFGEGLFEWLAEIPAVAWVALSAVTVLLVGSAFVWRIRRRRAAPS